MGIRAPTEGRVHECAGAPSLRSRIERYHDVVMIGRQPRTHPPVRPRGGAAHRDRLAPRRAPAQGRVRGRSRDASLLLFRGARRAGLGRTVRRIVPTVHPITRREGLAAHRTAQGEQPWRRPAPRHRTRHRPRRRARYRRALHPTPLRRLGDDPSGGVLPTQQPHRLGRGNPVADLRHPHRSRSGLPVAEVRVRTALHFPPQAHPRRRASVHLRHRLSDRTGDPTAFA